MQLPPSATVGQVRQQLQQQHALAPWPGMKVHSCSCVHAPPPARSLTIAQFVYGGSVLLDTATLKSVDYSSSKSLVVTTPPASSADSSASAAGINASIDSAYSASLAADAARQAP